MRVLSKYIWGLCLALLLTSVSYAQGLLKIEITQAQDTALPIAIVPIKWHEGGTAPSQDISAIVSADLSRSGEFKLMPANIMRQLPATPSEIEVPYWRVLGMEAVLVGSIKAQGNDSYQVQVALVDTVQTKTAQTATDANTTAVPLGPPVFFSKEFLVSNANIRDLAHHISDLVYEALTGYRGAFSTQIAYVTVQWNNPQQPPSRYVLEIADADGYNPRPLLASKEPIMSPAWSPNGKQLAYVSFERNRAGIYVSDIDTGSRRLLTSYPGINGAPAWSPDGSQLAVVLSYGNVPKVYLMDVATGNLRQVTFGGSIDTEPSWVPDGKSLIFTSNRGGQPQVYQVDLASNAVQRLTFDGNYNARASVTPDGSKLVMLHRDGGGFQIATLDLGTNLLSVLTTSSLDESPSLAPNGRMVIYGTIDGGRRVLGAVSIDGRVKLLLPAASGEVQEPAWSPFLS